MNQPKPQVLVVDDSLTVRMDLEGALRGAGFAVTACGTKAAALRALRSQVFSLAVLDVVLPDGDGIELLRELRANPAWTSTPVIVLSTEAELGDRVRGISTGADEYVGKPYDTLYVVRRACAFAGVPNPYERSSALAVISGSKILVVDDSPAFLAAISDELRRDNHDVIVARSAEEALELLRLQPVDCVVMDLVMPGQSGIDACRAIRSLPGRERTPVMIVTTNVDRAARREGIDAGVDDFIAKSADFDLLRVRVRGLLRKVRVPDAPPTKSALFDRIVAASGLPESVASNVIEEVFRRAGVDKERLASGDLPPTLPAIREALAAFMGPSEVGRRIDAMSALARLSAARSK